MSTYVDEQAWRLRGWGDWEERRWARLSTASLGALEAAVISAAPVEAVLWRTQKLIRQLESDAYQLVLLLSGELVLSQDGRAATLRPGDFALAEETRPFRMGFPGAVASQVVALRVPRGLLPLPPEEVARLTAVGMGGRRGAGALLSSLLAQLARHLGEYGPAEAARISTAVLDLLAAALAGRLDPSTPPGTHREALRHRIHAYIEQRLGDPELSPRTIAAACHISVRYLHKLFQEHDTTVAGWIRERRLERCRRDLADPALASRTVTAIAGRWGFGSAAHFSHAFRGAYGLPPTEYRRRALRHGAGARGPTPAPEAAVHRIAS